jgi:hypothetical protein
VTARRHEFLGRCIIIALSAVAAVLLLSMGSGTP